jgi:hypothetical protein
MNRNSPPVGRNPAVGLIHHEAKRLSDATLKPIAWLFVAISFLCTAPAFAQLTDPSFVGPQGRLNALEQRAAIANQAVFNQLNPICATQPPTPSCTGATLSVFQNVRELVQTAEEILTGTDRPFGLNLDTEGLGFALRWTAAEELLAQGSMANEFANSQSATMANRIAAIRIVSRSSIATAAILDQPDSEPSLSAADATRPRTIGAASADEPAFSRLSVFFDASGGYGTKDPTTLEDAFDFDGYEYTVGVDYRLTDGLVLGGLLGYTDRYVDFDSTLSIVDGFISSDGFSAIGFVQWDRQHFYATGSLGYQQLSYDILRRISYPSFDPNVPSTNTATAGSPDSKAVLASVNLGVPLQWKAFGVDLYAKLDYQRVTIDGFSERAAPVAGNSGAGFEFRVAEQTIKSADAALGLKLQWVLTPRFGVVVPFVRGELHRELEDEPRILSTVYSGLPASVNAGVQQALIDFGLSSDIPDDQYYTLSAGFSAVIRGSSRVGADGRGRGGLQGYLQYTTIRDLENYEDSVISGGLRYEF